MIDALRTPDHRFTALPGFPYAPKHLEDLGPRHAGLRLHYIDEGAREAGTTFLCLHGQPTWSYLYRRMIPEFLAAGHRVVAPDFFGFGRSDKPAAEAAYTFDWHRESLVRVIERLDLRGITLVCQDWGGLIGLTLPMDMPQRFTRLLVMNTTLATGDAPLPQAFLDWRAFNNRSPDMAIGKLMLRACPRLSPAEAAAYDAPFPDATYKAGVRRFPNLVPDRPDADGGELSRRARDFWRQGWTGASFMAVGMKDPVLGPAVMAALRADIRGCPPPLEIADGGHFLQEWGDAIARRALDHFGIA
jgi:haloalkane dehalogenase